MKKLLLSTVAVTALAIAAPAIADESGVKLEVGGGASVYGVWVDSENNNARDFDMLRYTEVHFSGETTLDNGLTVGAHIETGADNGDGFAIDESYLYMQGSWGRVNLGAEDGAAFLLQVAAPSADSNVDGVRQEIGPFVNANLQNLDYDQDVSGKSDKFTYLTPVFSGFQAGVSYTTALENSRSQGTTLDNTTDEIGDIFDLAARYEGQMDQVGLTVGAGYTHGSAEQVGAEDRKVWNAGIDLDIGAFGLGVAYMDDNGPTSSSNPEGTNNDDVTTWVLGADYTTGPFTLGASYMNQDNEVGTDTDTDRYTGGVVYSYGPGMSFRGSVSYADFDSTTNTADTDETAVLLGTQVDF